MYLENYSVKIDSIPVSYKIFKDKIILKFLFSFVFVLLMSVSANTFLYLPFTPIPITMQVLTVLISPLFLGSYWAAISQLEYILLGLTGLPVFSGFKSGIAALIGPTGGYIIGFLLASFIVGFLYEHFISNNKIFIHGNKNLNIKNNLILEKDNSFFIFLSLLSGVFIIYVCGYIHLLEYLLILNKTISTKELLIKTWKLGVYPFIIIDFLKILIILNIDKINRITKLETFVKIEEKLRRYEKN
jgi:biotin transport system substrate-specific component